MGYDGYSPGWVSRGLCPLCHHALSADEESIYCPSCAWRPTELAEDCDECGGEFGGFGDGF